MDRNCKDYELDFNHNLHAYENYKIMRELSDGIFHDFKNILANISGLTQLSILEAETHELKTNLNSIYKATSEFKDALTRYQELMKGNIISEKVPVQLNEIIKKSIEMVGFRFCNNKINNIKLVTSIHSNNKVLCNSYELYQAFLNLIMNSIDAMEESGGTLTISIYNIGDLAYVSIADTGVGISASDLKNILEEKLYTTKNHGSGLGLKIAKATFENHGGYININSIEGKGTEVNISLPIYNEHDD